MEVGSRPDVGAAFEWLLWLYTLLLAKCQTVLYCLVKTSSEGLDILPFVTDETADILYLPVEDFILVVVVD
jgi:hypothetical protein